MISESCLIKPNYSYNKNFVLIQQISELNEIMNNLGQSPISLVARSYQEEKDIYNNKYINLTKLKP